ncbi:MAG TPA: AbrB/MazE/SpoVT family DNA-binding domain-containing protein [Burkholderiales bacterium]|nr:AbrB/MazE/SpoVT family DNA-binding domain-containing protein [Burkholderiales bacterium]
MKTTLTVSSRGAVTLPAKLRKALGLKAEDLLIADKRIREFDEAEAELEKVLSRKKKAAR